MQQDDGGRRRKRLTVFSKRYRVMASYVRGVRWWPIYRGHEWVGQASTRRLALKTCQLLNADQLKAR